MIEQYKQPVFTLLKKIPKGRVVTYGQIAKELHLPSPRIVGKIIHQNTDPQNTPCHRVILSDGKLAQGYTFGGLSAQKKRLKDEGVTFAHNKINLALHRFFF